MADFWTDQKQIIGVAPMDGVTDKSFRMIIAQNSNPSVIMTEFTNVEGLARGAKKMLKAFEYDEIERPIVAQVYGSEVESFYKAAVMLCYLGFDGIDINMGCPMTKVAGKGSGAGLIKTPELAKDIIRAVQKGVTDWADGISLTKAGVHKDTIAECKLMVEGERVANKGRREKIPVSVKTRIGYSQNTITEWLPNIIETKPDAISVHGRTLKQMYTGLADWDAIAVGADLAHKAGITYLGNGDVKNLDDAKQRISDYGVDGVLVGRALFGNPWFFSGYEPTIEDRIRVAMRHNKLFKMHMKNEKCFHAIKKHLGWYVKGFDGAKEARMLLMQTNSAAEVHEKLKQLLNERKWDEKN